MLSSQKNMICKKAIIMKLLPSILWKITCQIILNIDSIIWIQKETILKEHVVNLINLLKNTIYIISFIADNMIQMYLFSIAIYITSLYLYYIAIFIFDYIYIVCLTTASRNPIICL